MTEIPKADEVVNQFLTSHLTGDSPRRKAKQLHKAVFGPRGLHFQKEEVTRKPKQAFLQARGNCISLALLVATFAEASELSYIFRTVTTPERPSGVIGTWWWPGHIQVVVEGVVFDLQPMKGARTYEIPHNEAIALFHANRGVDLLNLGRRAEALRWLEQAGRLGGENAVVCNNLGAALRQAGDTVRAEQLYRRAIEADPKFRGPLENLALLLWHQGRVAEAEHVYGQIYRGRYNPYTHLIQAKAAWSRGEAQQVNRLLKKALARFNNPVAMRTEMEVWLTSHDLPENKYVRVGNPQSIHITPDPQAPYSALRPEGLRSAEPKSLF